MLDCLKCGYSNYKKDKKCVKCEASLSSVGGEYYCTRCQVPVKSKDKFCPNCGVLLLDPTDEVYCGQCGAAVTSNFCANCGTPAMMESVKIRKKGGIPKILKPFKPLINLVEYIMDGIFGAIRDLL